MPTQYFEFEEEVVFMDLDFDDLDVHPRAVEDLKRTLPSGLMTEIQA